MMNREVFTGEDVEEVKKKGYKLFKIVKNPDGTTSFIYRHPDFRFTPFEDVDWNEFVKREHCGTKK